MITEMESKISTEDRNLIEYYFGKLSPYIEKNIGLDMGLISKAFHVAYMAHRDECNLSYQPYITHLLEVAKTVGQLGMDTDSIIAALLHDTIKEKKINYEDIKDTFGVKIANMVKGVTELSYIEHKFPFLRGSKEEAENYRKLLCAVSQDIRILIIKLADRLNHMQGIRMGIRNASKRKKIATETMEIYAPLAERIGIRNVKDELQDLAFIELYFKEHMRIQFQLEEVKRDRKENLVDSIVKELKNTLSEADLDVIKVFGREKRPFSIWYKIQNRNIYFEDMPDIFAFRIITKSRNQCYDILYAIHHKYRGVDGGFRDYIRNPKINGYRSLHTIVDLPQGESIEIQIRTEEMDRIAESGSAAHWRYKQDIIDKDSSLFWINEVQSMIQEFSNESTSKNTKLGTGYPKVSCFVEKNQLVSLPKGSTVLDLAFYIHPNSGTKCIGARIKGENVPASYQLKDGEHVKIIYIKKNKIFKLWNKAPYIEKAETTLEQLSKSKKSIYIERGKNIYKQSLYKLGIQYDENKIKFPFLYKDTEYNDINSLFYFIGNGRVKVNNVICRVYPFLKKKQWMIHWANFVHKITKRCSKDMQDSIAEILQGIPLHFAKCCFPVREDKSVIILNQKEKCFYIHRIECNACNLDNKMRIFNWAKDENDIYQAKISIITTEKEDLRSIIDCLNDLDISIVSINNIRLNKNLIEHSIIVETKDAEHLEGILNQLKKLKNVHSVMRYINCIPYASLYYGSSKIAIAIYKSMRENITSSHH